jgi:eukaryotic-like serine/threonine-protein kinase
VQWTSHRRRAIGKRRIRNQGGTAGSLFRKYVRGQAERDEALALARDREVQFGAAFAPALSGDSSRAQTLANDLEKNYPEDTAVRFNYMPSVRALLAQNHSERAKATELLQTAVSNELGQPRSAVNGFFGALYPIYVRGQAYLALHQRSPGSR